MKVDPYFLSVEARVLIAEKVKAQREDLAARRALRETAQTLGFLDVPADRRSANDQRHGDRRVQDRRGLWTVEVDGDIVIRPSTGAKAFDARPADVTAFQLDDEFRT